VTIKIDLTNEQIEQLTPLFDLAGEEHESGNTGVVYGQPIRYDGDRYACTFGFMNQKQHKYLNELSKGK
jgi:hypothetical protein